MVNLVFEQKEKKKKKRPLKWGPSSERGVVWWEGWGFFVKKSNVKGIVCEERIENGGGGGGGFVQKSHLKGEGGGRGLFVKKSQGGGGGDSKRFTLTVSL